MKRTIVTFLALATVLLAVPAAFGQVPSETQQLQQETIAEIEHLFRDLLGIEDTPMVFEDHGDGLSSLTIALPEGFDEPALDPEMKAGNKLADTLAAGLSLIEPSNSSSLINSVYSDSRFEYNYWWVVSNPGQNDVKLVTIVKLTGPGKGFKKNFNLTYEKKTVKLYFFDPKTSVNKRGVYTLKVTVAKGGAVTTKTYAK